MACNTDHGVWRCVHGTRDMVGSSITNQSERAQVGSCWPPVPSQVTPCTCAIERTRPAPVPAPLAGREGNARVGEGPLLRVECGDRLRGTLSVRLRAESTEDDQRLLEDRKSVV